MTLKRAIEVDLRIRIEQLHARRDFVGVGDGTGFVEHPEVHAKRANGVGETVVGVDEQIGRAPVWSPVTL